MSAGMDALAEAARIESARVYSRTVKERPPGHAPVQVPAAGRSGAAPAEVLRQLVDELSPVRALPPATLFPRVQVEQAIARGLDNEQIGVLLDLPTDRVADVRGAMDRAAS